jgi:peptide deformylase
MPSEGDPRNLGDVTLPPIVRIGEPILRARASEVAPEKIQTPEYQTLFETMVAVMRSAPGVGLAAPQIDIPLRVIVLEDREELMSRLSPDERRERGRTPFDVRTIVNPIVTGIGEERAAFFEGCLSVPGYAGLVDRYSTVEVTGLDEQATPIRWRVSGWPARILQHEFDHLEGTLYVDRMMTRSFATTELLATRFGGKSIAEIRRLLGV